MRFIDEKYNDKGNPRWSLLQAHRVEGQNEGWKLGGFFGKDGKDDGGEVIMNVSISEIVEKSFHDNVFISFHVREVLAWDTMNQELV